MFAKPLCDIALADPYGPRRIALVPDDIDALRADLGKIYGLQSTPMAVAAARHPSESSHLNRPLLPDLPRWH